MFDHFSTLHMKGLVYQAGIYLLKVNNRNTRTKCEICSKLTIKTPERRHWCVSGDCSRVSMIKSEYVIAG